MGDREYDIQSSSLFSSISKTEVIERIGKLIKKGNTSVLVLYSHDDVSKMNPSELYKVHNDNASPLIYREHLDHAIKLRFVNGSTLFSGVASHERGVSRVDAIFVYYDGVVDIVNEYGTPPRTLSTSFREILSMVLLLCASNPDLVIHCFR